MGAEGHGLDLAHVVALLAAAVLAVPLFRRLGLGSVLGYLGVGVGTGFPVAASFVSGAGFVLTSTAIVMQLLEERRQLNSPPGQRIVSVLLLEDMMIVPLLAAVAFLAPIAPAASN